MKSSAAFQMDAMWLKISDYGVTALNSRLEPYVHELAFALREGLPAYPDRSRANFYDLELRNGWCYVHVHDEKRTVYLVAYSRS